MYALSLIWTVSSLGLALSVPNVFPLTQLCLSVHLLSRDCRFGACWQDQLEPGQPDHTVNPVLPCWAKVTLNQAASSLTRAA